jgi:molybdopterin molybdotransferase
MECPHFVAVEEARSLILDKVSPAPTAQVNLAEGLGQVLSAEVITPADQPPFDNAAMDGYAFRHISTPPAGGYRIIGEIAAGDTAPLQPGPEECVRIFTGAPLPKGVDTVVQQEWVTLEGDAIHITGGSISPGANVRYRASHLKAGTVALAAGAVLEAPAIGFLAGLGIAQIPVHRPPRVHVLVTGSELVPPGQSLKPGQIYESNGYTLTAALKSMGITPMTVQHVADDPHTFSTRMQAILQDADILILSGGISVGDHDIVRAYVEQGQVKPVFYKVRQRPGKPMFFGHQDGVFIFALPGNPASVLTCFYQYVYPALRKWRGFTQWTLPSQMMILDRDYAKKPGLTFFLKARREGDRVIPQEGQLSYQMQSYALADSLIVLDEDRDFYEEGEQVRVLSLPYRL